MSYILMLHRISSMLFTKNVGLSLGSIVLIVILLKLGLKVRWYFVKKSYPRDIVVLHQFPRGYRIPNMSPFVLKLETWLRMTDIKYENRYGLTFGPKGKIPFITYNNQDIGDSQFIIEFLGKKFDKDLSKDHSPKDLALVRAFFKMAEESLFWVSGLSRFVHESNPKYMGLHPILAWLMKRTYKKNTHVQGYGRHTRDELFSIGKTDLKSLDLFLEGKKFLLGNKPCNEDASIFGIVAQFVYTETGTLNKYIMNECPNLVAYIENIKKTYWPDWSDCITRKNN